ncbi:hypothetical protein GCM10010512_27540 [Streptomyces thermoviolaceus subsp. thermoviolaceus]|nr:hypothetical protein GCM10010499_28890 [Streptomyces thermoviolaceus subsp. apingens]GHA94476.1 hypothetical protein GCM10010512_27540 [Streptomyces thermoviolaceus subsp. thermoviolaceus]
MSAIDPDRSESASGPSSSREDSEMQVWEEIEKTAQEYEKWLEHGRKRPVSSAAEGISRIHDFLQHGAKPSPPAPSGLKFVASRPVPGTTAAPSSRPQQQAQRGRAAVPNKPASPRRRAAP